MKKICLTLLCIFVILSAYSQQRPSATVLSSSTIPVIDGVIDEVWSEAIAYDISLPFKSEMPTLGDAGETYWKAICGTQGMYILLQITDDVFSPCFTDCNNWEFDKPELYFDCNQMLEDGMGAGAGKGHFQVAPGYLEDMITGGENTDFSTGVKYAHLLNDPDVTWEYLIPWSLFLDKDGNPFSFSYNNPLGFDITIIDNDTPGTGERRRAVWANDGNRGAADESWNNMDECGLVTFLGACSPIMVSGIAINSEANTISTDNGTLQMEAVVSPSNATNPEFTWAVESITGTAEINSSGLLRARTDGTVKVLAIAKDKSGVQGEKIITLTNQVISSSDLNLIRNGTFDLDGSGFPQYWSGWIDLAAGTVEVINGTAKCDPQQYAETWHYQFFQTGNEVGWKLYNDTSYILMFDAWSTANRTINVDFEDNETNQYVRVGDSPDANAINGVSEWVIPISTTRTRYTQHVTMSRLQANSTHKLSFLLSLFDAPVFLDNIALYSVGDYERLQVTSRTTLETKKLLYLNADTAAVESSILGITKGNLLQHGICWGTAPGPNLTGSKSELGSRNTLGNFISCIAGLSPNTRYYVRAYATDSTQTVYGNEFQFYSSHLPITIRVNSGQTRVYGSADPTEYTYTISSGSLMNGIPLNGSLTRAEGSIPGNYPITMGTLNSENNANYLISFEPADFTITPKPLTISGTKAQNKIYDGTTTASLLKGTILGIIKGDTVILQPGAAHFADKKVGGGKTVTVDGYSMTGAQAARYTWTFPSTTFLANITPAALSITGLQVTERPYDGTVNAELTGGTLQHVAPGDSILMIRGTGKFSSKNAGNNISVVVTGFKATGPDSANYTLTQPVSIKGNIIPVPLVVKANDQTRKEGEMNPVFTLSYSGFIGNETDAVFSRKPVAFCAADTSSAPGTYDILVGGGLDDNYAFFYQSGTLTVTDGTVVGKNRLSGLQVFPNPVTTHFIIHTVNWNAKDRYQLFDQMGRLVMEEKLCGPETEVRMDGLADGLYLVKISRNGRAIGSHRVMKLSE